MKCLGFLELNSIAKGVEAADKILKTTAVSLVYSKALCPGKYTILFTGEVADVEESMENGKNIGCGNVVDSVIIPRISDEVIQAINMPNVPNNPNAVGVLEFFSITSAVRIADVCVKAANIVLVDVRLGTGIGGKSFIVLTGDTAEVEEAVKAGLNVEKDSGNIIASVVIPNPREEVFNSLL